MAFTIHAINRALTETNQGRLGDQQAIFGEKWSEIALVSDVALATIAAAAGLVALLAFPSTFHGIWTTVSLGSAGAGACVLLLDGATLFTQLVCSPHSEMKKVRGNQDSSSEIEEDSSEEIEEDSSEEIEEDSSSEIEEDSSEIEEDSSEIEEDLASVNVEELKQKCIDSFRENCSTATISLEGVENLLKLRKCNVAYFEEVIDTGEESWFRWVATRVLSGENGAVSSYDYEYHTPVGELLQILINKNPKLISTFNFGSESDKTEVFEPLLHYLARGSTNETFKLVTFVIEKASDNCLNEAFIFRAMDSLDSKEAEMMSVFKIILGKLQGYNPYQKRWLFKSLKNALDRQPKFLNEAFAMNGVLEEFLLNVKGLSVGDQLQWCRLLFPIFGKQKLSAKMSSSSAENYHMKDLTPLEYILSGLQDEGIRVIKSLIYFGAEVDPKSEDEMSDLYFGKLGLGLDLLCPEKVNDLKNIIQGDKVSTLHPDLKTKITAEEILTTYKELVCIPEVQDLFRACFAQLKVSGQKELLQCLIKAGELDLFEELGDTIGWKTVLKEKTTFKGRKDMSKILRTYSSFNCLADFSHKKITFYQKILRQADFDYQDVFDVLVKTGTLAYVDKNVILALLEILKGKKKSNEKKVMSDHRWYPLFFYNLVRLGWNDVVQICVRRGFEINRPEMDQFYGKTPLHAAAQTGNRKLYAYLIAKGANTEARDNEGKKPGDYLVK